MTDYLADMCQLVISETSLLPHVNAGTLSDYEIISSNLTVLQWDDVRDNFKASYKKRNASFCVS